MKYTGGKSTFNNITKEWEYTPRVYTDFYCSLNEWAQFNIKGKLKFMYQLAQKIHGRALFHTEDYEHEDYEHENCFESIVFNAIKMITHKSAKVKCHTYYGTVIHVIIEFPNCVMPNIVVLIDEGGGNGGNGGDIFQRVLIYCIDAIYSTLHDKTTTHYDNLLYKYYNNKYDRIFYKSKKPRYGLFLDWKNKWKWNDVFRKTEDRNTDNNMGYVTYK